jgi:NAD+ synthase (glutamine-hydrolysing)
VVEGIDCSVGCETCEELFTPDSPNINLALNGVEIVGNGSGSHHELRKLRYRVDLMATMTKKNVKTNVFVYNDDDNYNYNNNNNNNTR